MDIWLEKNNIFHTDKLENNISTLNLSDLDPSQTSPIIEEFDRQETRNSPLNLTQTSPSDNHTVNTFQSRARTKTRNSTNNLDGDNELLQDSLVPEEHYVSRRKTKKRKSKDKHVDYAESSESLDASDVFDPKVRAKKLASDGYLYKRDKKNTKGKKVAWKCVQKKCPGKAHTRWTTSLQNMMVNYGVFKGFVDKSISSSSSLS